jgi:putative nucleotidyltransferase with HDIG domain
LATAVGFQAALYRVHQFASAWLARVSPKELREADELLPPGAQTLFHQMSVADQRHSLNVMHALRHAGHIQADLLAAALLHDVGKSAAPIHSWQRAIIVLGKRFAPGLLAWLTHGEPRGLRRAFVIHRQHMEIGAEWAAQAGCSALTVSLIRRHQEPLRREPVGDEERLLIALQRADGIN